MRPVDKPRRGADGRPRIHIWPHAQGAAWSHGPIGLRHALPSAGAALDDALAAVGAHRGVVVIIEAAEVR